MKNTIQKEKLGGLCCRMERTEDRIGEIQGKTTERKGEKNDQSPRDLWDDCKTSNILVEILEGVETGQVWKSAQRDDGRTLSKFSKVNL